MDKLLSCFISIAIALSYRYKRNSSRDFVYFFWSNSLILCYHFVSRKINFLPYNLSREIIIGLRIFPCRDVTCNISNTLKLLHKRMASCSQASINTVSSTMNLNKYSTFEWALFTRYTYNFSNFAALKTNNKIHPIQIKPNVFF